MPETNADNEFHREQLGELTTEEVEGIVSHLRWVEKFTVLMGDVMDIEPAADAGELADRLEWLLKKAHRRTAFDALQKGQCETVVDGDRCEGVKGHDGECPRPFPGDLTKTNDSPFNKETQERRAEYIGLHALEGEFDDIVKCMVEERRHTLEEVAAIASNPAAHLSNVSWEIKQLLKDLER